MDARALERYPLLRRMGVFGIDLDTPRGAARFLDVSLAVLRNKSSVLWITAEGGFGDSRVRPVRLRPGLAHLARRVPDAVLVPMAIEYTFWNERKPEALVRFGPPLEAGGERNLNEWQSLLGDELTRTMDALAAESLARNPALFVPVMQGVGGVGGVYDLLAPRPRGDARAKGRNSRTKIRPSDVCLSHGGRASAAPRRHDLLESVCVRPAPERAWGRTGGIRHHPGARRGEQYRRVPGRAARQRGVRPGNHRSRRCVARPYTRTGCRAHRH